MFKHGKARESAEAGKPEVRGGCRADGGGGGEREKR